MKLDKKCMWVRGEGVGLREISEVKLTDLVLERRVGIKDGC